VLHITLGSSSMLTKPGVDNGGLWLIDSNLTIRKMAASQKGIFQQRRLMAGLPAREQIVYISGLGTPTASTASLASRIPSSPNTGTAARKVAMA
jgi:hypothetical protein